MAQTHTDTNVNQLVINKMTKQEYDNLSQVSDTELYLVEEQVDSVVTQNSTNPVQSGAVYEALQQSSSNIKDGTTTFTKNNETIGTTSANQSVNQTIVLPNDVVMCNLIDNKALASYATPITRFKYIEDHGWVDMDRSNIQYNEGTGEWTGTFVSLDITEGEYYYDMDNKTVFVADENSEMQDVTSTVVIHGDINKLYCDVTTNILYRYYGSNFIALTSNFSGSYNDLSEKPLSVENSKVKYTLSDGTTKLTLAQEKDIKDIPITFTPDTTTSRAVIQSGDSIATIARKIAKKVVITPTFINTPSNPDRLKITLNYNMVLITAYDLIFPNGLNDGDKICNLPFIPSIQWNYSIYLNNSSGVVNPIYVVSVDGVTSLAIKGTVNAGQGISFTLTVF